VRREPQMAVCSHGEHNLQALLVEQLLGAYCTIVQTRTLVAGPSLHIVAQAGIPPLQDAGMAPVADTDSQSSQTPMLQRSVEAVEASSEQRPLHTTLHVRVHALLAPALQRAHSMAQPPLVC
jgi:hypothetical protein